MLCLFSLIKYYGGCIYDSKLAHLITTSINEALTKPNFNSSYNKCDGCACKDGPHIS